MPFSDNVEWHVRKTNYTLFEIIATCYVLLLIKKIFFKELIASLKRLLFKLKSQICLLCQNFQSCGKLTKNQKQNCWKNRADVSKLVTFPSLS